MIPLGGPLVLISMAIGWAYSLIPTVAYFIGAWTCAANRQLSPKLMLAMWGFGGLFAASAISLLSSHFFLTFDPFPFPLWWILNLLRTASLIVLIYGLRAAFAEIRNQTLTLKGPTDELA